MKLCTNGEPCQFSETYGLYCRKDRGNWQQLRDYNRPAILKFSAGLQGEFWGVLKELKGTQAKTIARSLKPGFRMAGGLTGLILGGGLGAGMAALMKKDSDAGQLLGKIQAQGGQLDEMDQMRLSKLLGEMYNSPSQFM